MKISTTLLLLFFLYSHNALSQDNPFGIDNKVYTYYQRCDSMIKSKEVLPMIDTLFQMAAEVNDARMQAVALSKYVDHYYYLSEHDSLKIWISKTQEFAKSTSQPKYYYFVWSRYITYYIKKRQYNLAFVEIEAMLKDANQENYLEAVADGFKNMATIYDQKKSWELAAQYYKKSIDLIESNGLENFNLSITYSSYGKSMLNMNDYDQAKKAMEKGVSLSKLGAQIVQCKINLMQYYINTGDAVMVKKLLNEIEPYVGQSTAAKFLVARSEYLRMIGKYKESEQILNSLDPDNNNYTFLLSKAKNYKMIGKYQEALFCLDNYIKFTDSLQRKDANIAFGEFALMLDVNRLNKEKGSLELAIQNEKLKTTTYIVISLGVLLFIGTILYVRVYRLNKKLKHSQNALIDKNNELVEADKKILLEKEKVEKASGMKTVFIQNMSHEIRTPLNSILGFSQMLTDVLSDNNQVKEYTDQISQNSASLLKLLGDIIEISKLDSMIYLDIHKERIDISSVCNIAIDQVNNILSDGVSVEFITPSEDIVVNSNEQMISVVVSNLLHNSAKFTKQGFIRVEYGLSDDRKSLQIVVTDTGIGIPVDKQELVFDRFVKLNDFSQGFGLGLSISRLSAQLIGGSLVFDRDYEDGCRVVFSVPV